MDPSIRILFPMLDTLLIILLIGFVTFWISMVAFVSLTGCDPKEYISFKKQEAANRAYGAWKLGFIAPRNLHYIDAIQSQSFYLFEVAEWENLQVYHHVDGTWYDIGAPALRGIVKINKQGVIGFSKNRHLVEAKCRIMIRVSDEGPCYILDHNLRKVLGERHSWHERTRPYRVDPKLLHPYHRNRWGRTSI